MINLEKDSVNKAPSDQEIQDTVNRIYDYAIYCHKEKEMGWGYVYDELVDKGIPKDFAKNVIDDLRREEHDAEPRAILLIGFGLLAIILTVLIALITDRLFWVIFLLGVLSLLWGLWKLLKFGICGIWNLFKRGLWSLLKR